MLNAKQKLFCEEYAKDYQTERAYRAVYGDKKCAYKLGNKLLHRPEVKEYIQQVQDELVKENVITANKILLSLDKIANDPSVGTRDRLKAIDLIQKQLGLQRQVVESNTIELSVSLNENKPNAE